MKRRDFIKNSSLMALSVSAFGGIHWNGKEFVGNTPTTTDILGPFYRPGAPMRSNLIPPGSKGIVLHLSGVIFKEDGKTPLENALIETWQCDENQHYDNTSDDYLFRGAFITGTEGSYHFKTVVPVPYKASPDNENSWRPAHIHIRVSSKNQQDLITQIYFKGDQYIDKDRSSSSPQSTNRILEITQTESNEKKVLFDIVMSKEFPLDQEVYKKITGLYQSDKSIIEFIKSDDLLLAKINGQLMYSFKYTGNNTFESGLGMPKVNFQIQDSGNIKATITTRTETFIAEKFLKYSE